MTGSGKKGAMTIAEGAIDYKVDVDVVFNGLIDQKDFVLRTCLDSLEVWKTKYPIPVSPFDYYLKGTSKKAAVVDGKEVWVFGIDATNPHDLVAAVHAGNKFFQVNPQDIISDIYVKNLNTEAESEMDSRQTLINANKSLYEKTCSAIKEAAVILGCTRPLNFWVFSNSKNPKIGQEDLHSSLSRGGASNVYVDSKRHRYFIGTNDGTASTRERYITNLHLAKIHPEP